MISIGYYVLKRCKCGDIQLCWLRKALFYLMDQIYGVYDSHIHSFLCSDHKASFVQHGVHKILNKWHPIAIWMLKFFPQISLTRDNFENYVNFSGRTKMTTIVSRTWQCYTRRFFSSLKHLSPQRQTLLVEKANKLRLSHWWGSNIKPFQDSSFMT